MNTPFIGVGKNPEGKDLPLGLGMRLAQTPEAMDTYGQLSQGQRDLIVEYIKGCTSSEDARKRISEVVMGLKNGQSSFS